MHACNKNSSSGIVSSKRRWSGNWWRLLPWPKFSARILPFGTFWRRDFKTLCRSQVWAIRLIVQCTSIVTNNITAYISYYAFAILLLFVFALRCTIGMVVQVISRVIKTDHCRSFPLSPSNTSTTIVVIVITAIVIISTNHPHCCHHHGRHPRLLPPSLSSSSPLADLLSKPTWPI